MHVCACVCEHVWEGEGFHITHNLYVNSYKLLHLSESPEVPGVSYVHLPQQYIAHLRIVPDGAFIKHTRLNYVSMDFHPRLEQAPKVICKSQLQSPLSLPNK